MKGPSEKSPFDPGSYLGDDAEIKLAEHVQKLQAADFASTTEPRISCKTNGLLFFDTT
jgi:hypothetical protein